MAERRPRLPRGAAPEGARAVRVGRISPSGRLAAANDNGAPKLARLRRAAWWGLVAAAAAWVAWTGF